MGGFPREPSLAGDWSTVTVPTEETRGFYAGGDARCDCETLSILGFLYGTEFKGDKKQTNTTVEIRFTATGSLTGAKGQRSDLCEGTTQNSRGWGSHPALCGRSEASCFASHPGIQCPLR